MALGGHFDWEKRARSDKLAEVPTLIFILRISPHLQFSKELSLKMKLRCTRFLGIIQLEHQFRKMLNSCLKLNFVQKLKWKIFALVTIWRFYTKTITQKCQCGIKPNFSPKFSVACLNCHILKTPAN